MRRDSIGFYHRLATSQSGDYTTSVAGCENFQYREAAISNGTQQQQKQQHSNCKNNSHNNSNKRHDTLIETAPMDRPDDGGCGVRIATPVRTDPYHTHQVGVKARTVACGRHGTELKPVCITRRKERKTKFRMQWSQIDARH